MDRTKENPWARFKQFYREFDEINLSLDISRMRFPEDFFSRMHDPMRRAFEAMEALEKGAIANPDEKRMVGHYWLRAPHLAPTPEIRAEIENTVRAIEQFAARVRAGDISGSSGPFRDLLLIGIGGSALGPQFVTQALGNPGKDALEIHFFDNTDPDGMDRVLAKLERRLGKTLVVVISKSGGTKETRNGMLEAQMAFKAAGLSFAEHAVAVTGLDSDLDKTARAQGWLQRFPMWDWVGGRTSELSAVGLLPAALQGFDIRKMLEGAAKCDVVTRSTTVEGNPAALLALMWYYVGNGKGEKDMVVLPYRDRLELFSKYLQQLVMESLGKALDLQGRFVNQGIAVYGNKGSTDQHAYVQQLRDGLNNFFVTFIEVMAEREGDLRFVEPNVTSGDYLSGFFLGTRSALYENDRESMTITVHEVNAFSAGVLIALFERAVGFYASLVGINAYHQPGVEAGKKAAGRVLELQGLVLKALANAKQGSAPEEIATAIGAPSEVETVFKICQRLCGVPQRKVRRIGAGPFDSKFQME
jgi:glucose-6-phosphate isomerase